MPVAPVEAIDLQFSLKGNDFGSMERLDGKQCYIILGLEPGATAAEIKDGYRELVRQWHPDKVAHNPKLQAIAEEELKNINAAYDFLKTYTFSKDTYSSQSSQSEKNQQEAEEAKRRKQEAEQQEQERQERESKRRKREEERLRVQQKAEAAYQREQLAQARDEAKRKEQEAKHIRAQQSDAQSQDSYSALAQSKSLEVEYTNQPCSFPGCPRKRITVSSFCKWHYLDGSERNKPQGDIASDLKSTEVSSCSELD